jgi:hypothetical protein
MKVLQLYQILGIFLALLLSTGDVRTETKTEIYDKLNIKIFFISKWVGGERAACTRTIWLTLVRFACKLLERLQIKLSESIVGTNGPSTRLACKLTGAFLLQINFYMAEKNIPAKK